MLISKVSYSNVLSPSNGSMPKKHTVIPQCNDEVSFTAKKLPAQKKLIAKVENFIKKLSSDDDDDPMKDFWDWYTRS